MNEDNHNPAEPFYLERSDEGVLLIHGFCGSPAKFYFLREFLREETNYSISIPLLSGHGTNLDDLEKYSPKDWINDVLKAYDDLKKHCNKINVIGYSMGGLLALILASKRPVENLATIAPAMTLKDKKSRFSFIAKYFMHYHKAASIKKAFPDEAGDYDLKYNIGYKKYPVKSIADLIKLKKMAKKALKNINSPLLIFHSVKDDLLDKKGAEIIYKYAASETKKLVLLKKSRHLVPLGPEREEMFKEILDFFYNSHKHVAVK